LAMNRSDDLVFCYCGETPSCFLIVFRPLRVPCLRPEYSLIYCTI
jgi:hypothetical protein